MLRTDKESKNFLPLHIEIKQIKKGYTKFAINYETCKNKRLLTSNLGLYASYFTVHFQAVTVSSFTFIVRKRAARIFCFGVHKRNEIIWVWNSIYSFNSSQRAQKFITQASTSSFNFVCSISLPCVFNNKLLLLLCLFQPEINLKSADERSQKQSRLWALCGTQNQSHSFDLQLTLKTVICEKLKRTLSAKPFMSV